MKIKVNHTKGNNYIVNGMRVIANNMTDALKHYASVHGSGATIIFPKA